MKRLFVSLVAGIAMLSSCGDDEADPGAGGHTQAGGGQGGSVGGSGGDGGQGGVIDPCAPEDNGWPHDALPDGYRQGSGYQVGARVPAFSDGQDQRGNTDVSLGQFYGSMILLSIGAVWCEPCKLAASSSQELMTSIEDGSDEFTFWSIEVLADDATPGGQWADEADAKAWMKTYGINFPILTGEPAASLAESWKIVSFPTYAVLDPELRIREIIEGYPGDDELAAAVASAWDEFRTENPDWAYSCAPEPIEPGCGNAIVDPGETCDVGLGSSTCGDLDPPMGLGPVGPGCDDSCGIVDDGGCGLGICSTTGTLASGFAGTASCYDLVGEQRWDVFTIPAQAGDCVHIAVDNGAGAADLVAYVRDAAGTFYGGAFDFSELDDELVCANPPPDGYGCPEASIVAGVTGDMELGIAQWGGCSTNDAEYTLHVAINGVDQDVSTYAMTDDTPSFP